MSGLQRKAIEKWWKMMTEKGWRALDRNDQDYAPFDGQGTIGKMHQLFDDEMDAILDEMNEALAA